MRRFNRYHVIAGVGFIMLAGLWLAALIPRIAQTYLEDDLLWAIPLVNTLSQTETWGNLFSLFHAGELTLFDGAYFIVLKKLFGFNFPAYAAMGVAVQFINSILLFLLLSRRMKCSFSASMCAAVLYLTFYGHFHAYLWPMAFHHLIIVTFFLVIIYFYLKTNECADAKGDHRGSFYWVLGFSLLAVPMRLSIVLLPLMMAGHLVWTMGNTDRLMGRFRLWRPVLILLSVYPCVVVLLGNTGDVLSGLLKPLRSLAIGSGVAAVLIAAGISIGFWYLFGLLLYQHAWARKMKSALQVLVWVIPLVTGLLPLCLWLWAIALADALGGEAFGRWQIMSLPTQGWMWFLVWAMMAVIYCCFMRSLPKSPHMVIFLIWFLLLVPYLGGKATQMPSRYLIYITPIFAALVSVTMVDFLPRRWGMVAVAAIVGVSMLNIGAIII